MGGFFIIPGEPEEVSPERPLIETLIKEGDEIASRAETIAPTNASVIEFRRLVEQAKAATTPEARRQALIKMEALEDEVKSIAKAIPPPADEGMPHTLPLEQVSKLETRIPLDLIRKDEVAEIERLTKEIQKEGIKEPITIRVREDGSHIVWDGMHRLIVAQNLGIKNVPVQFIGKVQKISPVKTPAVEEVKPRDNPMPEFIPEVQVVIDKWRRTIFEGGELIEPDARREIIRAGKYRLGVGETDRAVRAIKLGGDNPMPKTEQERIRFHERIFGKGAIPPFERLGRGQTVNDLMPMAPDQGPPLPRSWGVRWPWRK